MKINSFPTIAVHVVSTLESYLGSTEVLGANFCDTLRGYETCMPNFIKINGRLHSSPGRKNYL